MGTRRAFFILFVAAFFACAGDAVTLSSSVSEAAARKETGPDQKVTLNFVDVELPVITKFISEITGKNFIFDERLKGRITIIAPTKLGVDDAFTLFTSVLELKGFTVVPSGIDAFKIIPTAEAKQRGVSLAVPGKTVNESYIARLIPVENISSDDVLKFVQPMVSKDGYISTFGPGNLLLVIDAGLNVEKILTIVESIDKPAARGEPDIVILRHASADAVVKILNEGYGRGKTRTAMGQPVTEEARAVADQRLNAVILFGDKAARESMKSLISVLDVTAPETQGRINVYFLENSDATEMAKILEGIVRGAQPQRQPQPGAQPVTPFEAVGGITVTPDKATNALIIVASPADYSSLAQVLRQLDKKSRQVFVEVMVAEVSVNRVQDLGTKWRATATKDGEPIFVGGVGEITQETLQQIITGLSGLSLGGFGNFFTLPAGLFGNESDITIPGFAAIFRLNEFKDAINVLSTPQILTSDNREAEIIVAENVPFITQRLADVQNVNSVLSSVERRDVGIILRITPQITEGDSLKLNIYQEISALKPGESNVILITVGPSITKRSTKTSVVVQDKQTVVIGGLMQDREDTTVSKFPLLGDIPVLGWLFKTERRTKDKINLVVFITPHIVREPESLSRLSREKNKDFARASELYTQGEILVKFKDNVTDDEARAIIAAHGAVIIRIIDGIGVYHLSIKKGQDVQEAVKEFGELPQVQYAEPNYTIRMQGTK